MIRGILLMVPQVPQPVREAAARSLGATARIQYVVLADGRYEAEAIVDGRERDVTISATGEVVAGDDGDDDDDDGDEEHDD